MAATGFELGTDGPLQILVGVDSSETSMRAAAYAAGMARRQGAKLLVLYVKTASPAAVAAPEAVVAMNQSQDQLADDIQRQIDDNAPRLGLDAELVVREGNPYAEILRLAEERRVDAIVVGASMQAGHKLVGSLATKLVRKASWPVTVVP
jgi:nucleotide-binding universal stress UspA family protein